MNPAPPNSPDPPVFASDQLPRFVGDAPLIRETLGLFLVDAPGQLLRIEAAAHGGDGPPLDVAAHKFKGSALQIGGIALAEACQALVTLHHPATGPLATRLARLRAEHVRLREAVEAYLAVAP